MGTAQDLSGKKFGSWEVVSFSRAAKRRSWQNCKCSNCGIIKEVRTDHLKSGGSISCGGPECRPYFKKHGLWKTAEYRILQGIQARCRNPNFKQYADYGGRGIDVFQGWLDDPQSFIDHIGLRPKKGKWWIERIDNDIGYFPGNVKWATPTEQLNNTRRSHFVIYKNERMTIKQLAVLESINYDRLAPKIRKGMSPDEAVIICKEIISGTKFPISMIDEAILFSKDHSLEETCLKFKISKTSFLAIKGKRNGYVSHEKG